jgi:hypothetical protein
MGKLTSVGKSLPGRKRCGVVLGRFDTRRSLLVAAARLGIFVLFEWTVALLELRQTGNCMKTISHINLSRQSLFGKIKIFTCISN